MYKTTLVILSSFLLALSAYSQVNSVESYEEFCRNFILSIDETTEIDELETYFDERLQSATLRSKLEIFKSEIVKYKSRSEYYIIKVDNPLLFYNIHVYDPDTKESYGNLRLLFEDQSDYLIDDWIYLIEQKELESMDSNLEELSPIEYSNPLPPPPPPHKNN